MTIDAYPLTWPDGWPRTPAAPADAGRWRSGSELVRALDAAQEPAR